MLNISNHYITASFLTKGAELTSIISNKNKAEYIWQGDAWPKHSPILFPIVGALKEGKYYYNNQSYELGRHGFARDMDFTVVSHSDSSITFLLKHDARTASVYPFHFELYVTYTLVDNHLKVHYKVCNLGTDTMPFSIGAHPAFKMPLEEGHTFEDYQLDILFDDAQVLPVFQYPLTTDGLLITEGMNPLENRQQVIPLHHDLFKADALVYQHISGEVTIKLSSIKSARSVTIRYRDFPFLGIWNKYQSDFVCIEPWCGITDYEHSNQQVNEKVGIISLDSQSTWENEWYLDID